MDESSIFGTKKYALKRLEGMRKQREPWLADWMDLQKYGSSRKGVFDGQDKRNPNDRTTHKINSMVQLSLRTLQAGMVAGNTSPVQPWIKVGLEDYDLQGYGPMKNWLALVQQSMHNQFRRTNFYGATPRMYADEGLFGTAFALQLEHPTNLIHYQNWAVGTYCLSKNYLGEIDTAYRETKMTALEMYQQFGKENMSNAACKCLEHSPDELIDVVQAIEPRLERDPRKIDSTNMPWASLWFEKNSDNDKVLRKSGFKRFPGLAPRWDVGELSPYGSGPGIDSLSDNKQLQFNEKKKSLNIDLMGNPPRSAPPGLQRSPIGGMPGNMTFYDAGAGNQRIEQLVTVQPQAITVLREDIAEIENRIRKAFYVDTFMMLANKDRGEAPTAREVEELHLEKMIELGPVTEQQQRDLQQPAVEYLFHKMLEQSKPVWNGMIGGRPMLPPPPKELLNSEIRFEFIGLLAQAQKSVGMIGIEKVYQFAGLVNQLTGDPSIMDNLDHDAALREFAERAGPPPSIVKDPGDVAAVRDASQRKAAAQESLMAGQQIAAIGKDAASVKTDDSNLMADMLGRGKKR
jgi:hypothetical protein